MKRYEIKKIGVYKVKIYDNLREKEIIRLVKKEKGKKKDKRYVILECKKVYV